MRLKHTLRVLGTTQEVSCCCVPFPIDTHVVHRDLCTIDCSWGWRLCIAIWAIEELRNWCWWASRCKGPQIWGLCIQVMRGLHCLFAVVAALATWRAVTNVDHGARINCFGHAVVSTTPSEQWFVEWGENVDVLCTAATYWPNGVTPLALKHCCETCEWFNIFFEHNVGLVETGLWMSSRMVIDLDCKGDTCCSGLIGNWHTSKWVPRNCRSGGEWINNNVSIWTGTCPTAATGCKNWNQNRCYR